jgi:predicted nucleic acid-binding Zn ribbon protein
VIYLKNDEKQILREEERARQRGKKLSLVLIVGILIIALFIFLGVYLVFKNFFTGICGLTNC